MNNDKELKARVEEKEKDLQFYLRYYHELVARSPSMKAVIDKEILQLEKEIKDLARLLR